MEGVNQTAMTLILLGGIFLLGLLTDAIGRHTRLPRVTLLLIFGVLMGPEVFGVLTEQGDKWFPFVANMALVMVGFLLGEKFTIASFREHGRIVLWISVMVVLGTATVVFLGLFAAGIRTEAALVLAAIATATAPAATMDVFLEVKADGPFARTLLRIVAVDDAWGLILFSLILSIVHAINGHGESLSFLLSGVREIGGAVLLGVVLGIPMAFLTGRVRPGEPTLVEAVGVVFLCGGVAIWLDVSYLLASIVLGTVVANCARHHTRPFHAIEDIEWPFMVLFFVLAGASLELNTLGKIGPVGAGYIALRIVGRFIGVWTGSLFSNAGQIFRRWMGMALLPQAGVAIGMALITSQQFPRLGETILPVAIGATVFFELIGPVLTRIALNRAGEVGKGETLLLDEDG
jgi:Kef-type K+ transport system membrane component KefB